ncbi:hypothetical protein RI129_011877 [Pyrocoelia pectoralis]|uniref:Ubiquitin carboxyl-terminal hydrolase n=1 Tax=Pyrocoelia pectoralis TaxID=417401 RepID=A0AAN7UXL2_9COLE
MGYSGCGHLEQFIREEEGLKMYELLHGVFVISGSRERRDARSSNTLCYVCFQKHTFLHVCMHCTFFGCHSHIREHSKVKKHSFSMDLLYGQMYCSQCSDYVYHEELDNIARSNALHGDRVNKCVLELVWPCLCVEDKEFFDKTDRMVIDRATHIGLRGLLNLGSTCFMNCVIQAMTHIPVLRDYFFTEHHQCTDTPSKCLITNLFRAFYTGEKTPLVLNEFLSLIWTQARHLAGYEQQDAHEFFIATLDVLHIHCQSVSAGQPNSSGSKANSCTCIIDQVFTGSLQSDVVCQKCCGVSTTLETMWDYSLDLTPSVTDGSLPSSLEDCLERFTGTEILGSNSKIFCDNCQSYQESTKQFTMRTLPVVLCFHLKRFQHLNDLEKKVSAKINYPELLDMTPFMTKQKKDSILNLQLPYDNKYLLFAVINHLGSSINAGHYISYIRYKDNFWYKCDDLVISEAGIEEVLESEGYLLFYHKYCLEYR